MNPREPNWMESVEEARRLTEVRNVRGLNGPLLDKRDRDEWRIRKRINRKWFKRYREYPGGRITDSGRWGKPSEAQP
jgi:hypothetical protein